MKVRCVIFDSDGTLVDSERLAMALLVKMTAENGISLPLAETTQEFSGVRLHRVIASIEERFNTQLPEQFIPEYRVRLAADLEKHLQPMPGIRTVLHSLLLPCCIASNAPLEKLRLCLSATGLDSYFNDEIYSAYEVGSWKPEPGLFLAAAQGMGYSPGECAVVEDSVPGIRAGLDAGMTVIAYRQVQRLDPRVLHIEHHDELAPLLKELSA
ncbi:MAG: HAD-IA family hydrolase [Pseudomonadota bacterium]